MIHFIVDSVVGDPAAYVHGLIERCAVAAGRTSTATPEHIEAQAANALALVGKSTVPLVEAARFPPATSEQLAEVEKFKRKARMALAQEIPLAKDELVEEEFYSMLEAPFLDLPMNTSALRRKTNQAVLYYFFEHVQVIQADLVPKSTPAPGRDRAALVTAAALSGEDWNPADLAKGLGSGLVNGALGTIGALIFNSIFPPGTPSYFGEVYKQMTKIFKQQLASNEVDKINGRVNGVKLWVQNTYTPRKLQASVPRKELADMLTPMVDLLYTEAIGILMVDSFKKCGMSVFPLTACMHLALVQEQALVDPDENDPLKSSFATTVKSLASTYEKFVQATYSQMRSERAGAVVLHTIPSEVVCTDRGCHNSKEFWWVEDTITGNYTGYYSNDSNHDHQYEAARAVESQWKSDALNKMNNDLAAPFDVAGSWRALETTPIPKH